MCLAQGHNAVMPVRLEPVAPRSRVKRHSTTALPIQCVESVISILNYPMFSRFLQVSVAEQASVSFAYAIKRQCPRNLLGPRPLGPSWNVPNLVTYYLQGCIWLLTTVRKSYWTWRKEDFNFKDRYVNLKSNDKIQKLLHPLMEGEL